jgi:hypothetical protein
MPPSAGLAQTPKKEPLVADKAFWAKKPVRDTVTICLMSFDSDKETIDSTLGKLDVDIDASGVSDLMMAAGPAQESIKTKSVGDAVPVPVGRFGGGTKLAGKGGVEIGPIVWDRAFGHDRTLTIDMWVCPDRGSKSATLVNLPQLSGGSLLKVVRDADGTVSLQDGKSTVIRHSRLAPSEIWTHVALIWPLKTPVQLVVNGLPVSVPEDLSALLSGRVSTLTPQLFLGTERDLKNGFDGMLDEIRLSSCARPFYYLADDSFRDVTAQRPFVAGPPYFVRTDKPLLACSFDGTLAPEVFAGTKASGKVRAAAFQPGVRGQAYDMSTADKDGFRLDGSGLFPMTAGTIEFWMRPLDWDNLFIGDYLGLNVRPQMLLQFGQANYPTFRGLRAVHVRKGRGLQETSTDAGFVPIHPGVWTHVMCVWNQGRQALYLNGKRQPSTEIVLNSNYHYDQPDWNAYVKAGGLTNNPALYGWSLIPSATLIDEWRLYARPYSDEEAANAYARWFPDASTRLTALPPIRANPFYDFNTQTLNLSCTCLPVNEVDPASLHLTFVSLTNNETLLDGDLALDTGFCGSTQIVRDLPFGQYRIDAASKDKDGNSLASKTFDYKRSMPPWWQNTLGKDRTVPTPWTPIQAGDKSLSVWGRTVTLATGGFPAQIEAAGTNVLAAALRLHGTVAGQPCDWIGQTVDLTEKSPDLATWSGRSTAAAINADVKASMEYDGMMSFAVTLTPEQAPVALDSLCLDVPFRTEVGTELIVNGGGNNFRAAWDVRFVPAGTNRVWNSLTSKPSMQKAVARGSFCPVVWIGDDERGLCFFGENDRGWTPNTNAPAQEIRRENNAVVYRMNVISTPISLTQPRTFTFVIHPTPTKPLPEGWRAYNRGGVNGRFANLEGIDACISPTLTAPSNATTHLGMTFVLEPPSWEEAKANGEVLRVRAGKNSPRLFYMDYSWPKLGPSMAEYRVNLWSRGRMLWTREVEDYMTWIINEYIKRDIIDGLYIDDTSLGANAVPFGTAYALEDGTMQPGFNTLGFRRFLKRVRLLFVQAGKQPTILPHMTYCFEIPALSFADACVNGEDRDIYYPATHFFPQTWSRDELRIQSSSPKWGFIAYWKNLVVAKDVTPSPAVRAWAYWQSRAMHSLAIQNDLWYMWANENRSTIEPALTAFGMDGADVRFIPDWRRRGILDVAGVQLAPTNAADTAAVALPGNTNAVMVCAYARKDHALMMISNLGPKEQVVTISVTPASLFEGCRSVKFGDADTTLIPPENPAASRDEIKKARQNMTVDLDSIDGKPDTTSVDDLLSDKTAEQKTAARLALQSTGTVVTVPVRPWDFRLVAIRPAP